MDVAHRFAPLGEQGSIACPFCGGAIVLDPMKILRGETINCGRCEASLTVDRAESGDALALLETAMARAEGFGKTAPSASAAAQDDSRRRARARHPRRVARKDP